MRLCSPHVPQTEMNLGIEPGLITLNSVSLPQKPKYSTRMSRLKITIQKNMRCVLTVIVVAGLKIVSLFSSLSS